MPLSPVQPAVQLDIYIGYTPTAQVVQDSLCFLESGQIHDSLIGKSQHGLVLQGRAKHFQVESRLLLLKRLQHALSNQVLLVGMRQTCVIILTGTSEQFVPHLDAP